MVNPLHGDGFCYYLVKAYVGQLMMLLPILLVTGLKILGRVGTHIFLNVFLMEKKNINLCILKGFLPFKIHKNIFFPENLKKSRFRQ